MWWFARGVSLVAAVLLCAGGLPLSAPSRARSFPWPTPGTLTALDQGADEGSLVVPQEEASENAD